MTTHLYRVTLQPMNDDAYHAYLVADTSDIYGRAPTLAEAHDIFLRLHEVGYGVRVDAIEFVSSNVVNATDSMGKATLAAAR